MMRRLNKATVLVGAGVQEQRRVVGAGSVRTGLKASPFVVGSQRFRSGGDFKRSDVTDVINKKKTSPLASTPPSERPPQPKMRRAGSFGEHQEVQGLGAAMVHGTYDHLGEDVGVPPFLKVPKTASVIGAPMSWGQPRAGTDCGSQILRSCGMEGTLINLEWRIDDQGDLTFDEPARTDPQLDPKVMKGRAKNAFCVGKGLKKIHDRVYDAAMKKEFVLLLGGDHSVSAGSVSAILRHRPETGIIWVDAHGDLNTPESSPSGNMHGMPLGLMMGLCNPSLIPGFEWFSEYNIPVLKPEQIVFVGLRDLDPSERQALRDMQIKAFTMQHVDRYGIGNVMEMAIDHLRLPNGKLRPLHLSYDIDAVDPEVAPSTGTIVRGGLTFREAHFVAEAVSETNMLGSMDLVEVNPKLGPGPESEMTAGLGMAIIASAMGSRII